MSASPVVRPIEPGDLDDWLRAEQRSFGIEPSEARLAQLRPAIEADRSVAAYDDGQIVATGGAYSTQLTLPGGDTVAVAGITAIGTRPSHTRRGLFRAVMDLLHNESAARDEPACVLLASEALLYPRFDYGVATEAHWVGIDRRRAARRSDHVPVGTIDDFVDVASAHDVIHDIWHREQRPGWLHRPIRVLESVLADHEEDRHGAMALTLCLHRDDSGRPDGYCLYRRQPRWHHGQSTGTLVAHELVGTDAARLALWHHLLGIDLVERIEVMPNPIDDPLPATLTDRRQFQTLGRFDQLWIRPLDVGRLLGARRYAIEFTVVVDVEGAGRLAVTGGPDGAEVAASTASPDLTVTRADIGTLVVGNSLRPLVSAGRAVPDAGRLDLLDAFFRWPVAPFNMLDF